MVYFQSMKESIRNFWGKTYLSFRQKRDMWLKPACDLLIKYRVSANHVTGFRLFLGLLTPMLLGWNLTVVLILMALNLLLDGIDGGIARISALSSKEGKLFDLFVDHSVFIFFVLGLVYWKLIDGFLAAFYLVNYLIIFFINFQSYNLTSEAALMSKSKYFVLIAFLVLSVFGLNWLDYSCLVAGVYLFVLNIFTVQFYIRKL